MNYITTLLPNPKCLPQCEALRTGSYANDKKGVKYRCEVSAKYRIGGRNLCGKHAQSIALQMLLELQESNKLGPQQLCFGCVDGQCTNNCWSSNGETK
jgi:hypothetical protein